MFSYNCKGKKKLTFSALSLHAYVKLTSAWIREFRFNTILWFNAFSAKNFTHQQSWIEPTFFRKKGMNINVFHLNSCLVF